MAVQFVQGSPLFTNINKVKKQYNYLTEDIDTEVIIVGGGVTGSILGYYFSKEGIDSVILEKSRIAHGSPSITTSLLQYELDSNLMSLMESVPSEQVINSYKLGITALIEYEYCGAFASTKDNLGFIGKDPNKDKLWYVLGYGANGILFAILGGLMLPKLYKGEVDEYLKYFKVDRFD